MLGDKSWDGTCQSEMPLLLPPLTALVVHVQARKISRYILNIFQVFWSVKTIQHPPLRYCCIDHGMATADQSQSTAVTEAAVESCERQTLRRDAEVLRLTMKHPHTITDTLVIGPMWQCAASDCNCFAKIREFNHYSIHLHYIVTLKHHRDSQSHKR